MSVMTVNLESTGRATIARVARAMAFLAVVAVALPALAQDFDDIDAPPAPVVQDVFTLSEANFDNWVYGNARMSGTGADRFESLLALTIEDVERSCRLTEAQRKKLVLAGRGDIKHFQDRVEEARRVFRRYQHDRTKLTQIHQETVPLAASFRAGLFGEGSFFAKTLRTTLDPGQADLLRMATRDRDRFRYRAKVAQAVANLDHAAGLTVDQRRRLVELMLAETSPPRKVDGPYEATVVLLKMARLPEEKTRAIFDDAQWRSVGRLLEQARAMEPILRSRGYLDEAEAGPRRTEAPRQR